jgi:hypothetical protein
MKTEAPKPSGPWAVYAAQKRQTPRGGGLTRFAEKPTLWVGSKGKDRLTDVNSAVNSLTPSTHSGGETTQANEFKAVTWGELQRPRSVLPGSAKGSRPKSLNEAGTGMAPTVMHPDDCALGVIRPEFTNSHTGFCYVIGGKMAEIPRLEGLNQEAFERWLAYRKSVKKPIKEASLHAAALKQLRIGNSEKQEAAVDHSIANGYQGLFAPTERARPGEKPEKTDKQKAADMENWQRQQDHSIRTWEQQPDTAFKKLKMCEALWARYTISPDSYTEERLEWLKDTIALHLRNANAKEVLGDPHLMTMVWVFYGAAGANRIKARAAA